MSPTSGRTGVRHLSLAAVLLIFAAVGAAQPESGAESSSSGDTAYPVGERLGYAVSWMGIRCGKMEIVSFQESGPDGESMLRIVVFARTSPFFDGIYRVRSRLDSFFDPERMSSVRYEEHASEKRRRKEEIWRIDENASEVVRIKNGETTRIPIDVDRAHDPLAYIFRLRTMPLEIGQEEVLNLMTSRGVAETVARVTERDQVRTKLGRCDAVAVVPEPRDRMMFSKSGSMVVWLERSPPHRPCRIEFDLSFGKLVAKLESIGRSDRIDIEKEWTVWSAE